MPAAKPYEVLLARSITSSRVLNLKIDCTGPNIYGLNKRIFRLNHKKLTPNANGTSSWAMVIESVTSEKIVGSTKNPEFPHFFPPSSNFAPSLLPKYDQETILFTFFMSNYIVLLTNHFTYQFRCTSRSFVGFPHRFVDLNKYSFYISVLCFAVSYSNSPCKISLANGLPTFRLRVSSTDLATNATTMNRMLI